MKHLYISIFMLSLIFVAVFVDSEIVTKKSEKIIEISSELSTDEEKINSEENLAKINEISDFWDKNKLIFDISVNKIVFDQIEENIIKINEFAGANDYSHYKTSLVALVDSVEKVMETSKISFMGIL